jgi:hypothetical protein
VVPQRYLFGDNFLHKLALPVVLVAVGVVSGIIFLPLTAKIILGLIGFSAIGPVAGKPSFSHAPHIIECPAYSHVEYAGSLAALIQAAIGNVAAGSLFAALQSFAMGGALGGVLSAVGGVVGGIFGAIAAFF